MKLFTGAIVGGEIGVLPMSLEPAMAVVAEAHRMGKPAFAHPTPDDGQPWTPELVDRPTSSDMALIPTLTLWRVASETIGLRRRSRGPSRSRSRRPPRVSASRAK